ncbi:MAG TPA: STAS domain-containing protein [Candidatus Krumholzibacteria bacterium]|nr:STAS domain-containing protein [Candidatus Krumholzibacteria bacterium]
MSIELEVVTDSADVSHVKLKGRLDALTLRQIDARFHGETAARRRSAIVDISELDFITSLGIGMLFGCAKSLRRHGATMVLIGSTGFVDNALRTVGVNEVIPFAETMEDALRLARESRS